MQTINQTKALIKNDPANWRIYLMDFVDDFRYYRDPQIIAEAFELDNERIDALLASSVEYLCYEMKIKPPDWVIAVPAPKDPWFVSGIENLKAIAIVESPLAFRIRKIFVLENFLSRV